MKAPSSGMFAATLIGITAITLLTIGPPGSRKPPSPAASASRPVPPSSVSGRGFTLTSASIELPIDDAAYPDGPRVDVVNTNCTSCHSASMATTQPALSAEKWKATVLKMRDVYGAPVADDDIDAIVAFLSSMPGQTGGPVKKDSKFDVERKSTRDTG